MSVSRPIRNQHRGESGQGLIEGAGALICCLLVISACMSLIVLIIAKFEIDSATADATASTLAAPLGAGDQSKQLAQYAFSHSLASHSWIQAVGVDCTSEHYFQGQNAPGSKISCVGTARVRLSMLPIPGGVDFTISGNGQVAQPSLRQCGTVTSSEAASGC